MAKRPPMTLPRLAIRLPSAMDARRSSALAQCAEANGFDAVWFAENPYQRGVLPAMTASAMATEALTIGVGVFNPFNRHPTLMAMEVGALDELSGGRAVLGIGSGVPAWIEKITPYQRGVSAVRDAVTIARALLAGEEVSYCGRMYCAEGVRLEYDLVRGRVPVYVAAMGEQMLRLCGEIGDGLLIGNMCPPTFTARALQRLNEGAKHRHGGAAMPIVKYVPCAIHRDPQRAREIARHAIGTTLNAFWNAYRHAPGALAAIRNDNGIDEARFSRALQRLAAGEPGEVALDDAFIDAYGIAGNVDQCIEQIQHLARCGVSELTLTILGDTPENSLRMIGEAIDA